MAEAATTETSTEKAIRESDVVGVAEWLEGLSAETGAIRVTLIRKRPKIFNGVNIEGTLENFEELISEEDIFDQFGGGSYQLKVHRQNDKGGWKYLTARGIKIAGDPKMSSVYTSKEGSDGNGASTVIAEKSMAIAAAAAERAEERAAKAAQDHQRNSGADIEMIRAATAPFETMAAAAREDAVELRRQLHEVATRKPESGFQDKILEKMIDQESSRIEAIRMQHDSELRALRENHRAEIKELRADHRRDMDRVDAQHTRELTSLQAAQTMAATAVGTASDVRVDAQKAINDQLTRELTVAQAEVATLRAKKEKPLTEQMGEFAQIREAMTGLGIGGNEEGGGEKWYERLVSAAGASPVVARLLGAPEEGAEVEQPTQAMEAGPPPNVPFRAADGNYYVRTEAGQIHQIDPQELRRRKAAKARANGEAGGGGEEEPEVRKPSETEVATAISFMESAIKANTDPGVFANTARSQLDQGMLLYLGKVGIDDFLNKVANLSQLSVLREQRGRNWARQVAKILLEGPATATE